MDAPVERNAHGPSERTLSLCIAVILTLASTALMLGFASPDFLCDEADYANAGLANSWRVLWSTADYRRHGHGPMAIYLVKLGQQLLPANALSLENRLRFFPALVGSIGIGLLYLILRHVFRTSRAAALVGSGMLLFSVIRLGETNVIGPHHLMLVCTLAIAGVGYHYKSSATLRAGVTMGFILGFGALAMTYVIPAALCWFLAVGLRRQRMVGGGPPFVPISVGHGSRSRGSECSDPGSVAARRRAARDPQQFPLVHALRARHHHRRRSHC